MTTLEQAARIALEALENVTVECDFHGNPVDVEFGIQLDAAVEALRQALAQPTVKDCLKVEPKQEQEPYCWKVLGVVGEFTGYYAEEEAIATAKRIGSTCEAFPLYTQPQAVMEQQPVAELFIKRLNEDEYGDWEVIHFPGEIEKLQERIVFNGNSVRVPLYTEPPKREWVGLTDDEVKHEWEVWRASLPRYAGFAKGIEAKLKEKNSV